MNYLNTGSTIELSHWQGRSQGPFTIKEDLSGVVIVTTNHNYLQVSIRGPDGAGHGPVTRMQELHGLVPVSLGVVHKMRLIVVHMVWISLTETVSKIQVFLVLLPPTNMMCVGSSSIKVW